MTYKQILKQLEQVGDIQMRLDLAPTQEMLRVLKNPDQNLSSIIVSGTNGKGSTCTFLTSIAKAAGLRVGTYTSPHLSSPTERIAIDGNPIDTEIFGRIGTSLLSAFGEAALEPVTYFEFMTMMAIQTFVHQRVDLAIFEVGLGGRLDCTNALSRIGTITTRIDYDHMQYLGNTLAEIAQEKGAIMRKGLPAIVAEQPQEAEQALITCAKNSGAHLLLHGPDFKTHAEPQGMHFAAEGIQMGPLKLALRGQYQTQNAGCAAAMALELKKVGFPIDTNAIREGLTSALHPGCLEHWTTSEGKEVWLDTAHNPGAARELVRYFQEENLAPVDIVLGMLKDKDWKGFLEMIQPITKTITLCKPNSRRSWIPEKVPWGSTSSLKPRIVLDPWDALLETLQGSKRVLVTGSSYVVGAVRSALVRAGWTNI